MSDWRQLAHRSLEVIVVEQASAAMATVDPELGRLIGQELAGQGARLATEVTVRAIHPHDRGLRVVGDPGFAEQADLVLVVVGVRPDSTLAAAAGAELGARDAIAVDRQMRTNLPGVWAAADCVHTRHRLLPAPTHLPLGTTAHKQGRIAGDRTTGQLLGAPRWPSASTSSTPPCSTT